MIDNTDPGVKYKFVTMWEVLYAPKNVYGHRPWTSIGVFETMTEAQGCYTSFLSCGKYAVVMNTLQVPERLEPIKTVEPIKAVEPPKPGEPTKFLGANDFTWTVDDNCVYALLLEDNPGMETKSSLFFIAKKAEQQNVLEQYDFTFETPEDGLCGVTKFAQMPKGATCQVYSEYSAVKENFADLHSALVFAISELGATGDLVPVPTKFINMIEGLFKGKV